MKTPTTLQDIYKALDLIADDYRKFYLSENKTAGTRVRKGMQLVKKLSQEIREHIQQTKALFTNREEKELV